MINEIGAGIGGAAGISAIALVFRFLNAKIDKKQNKDVCTKVTENFSKNFARGEERFDKIIDKLERIQVATGKIEQQLSNGR